MVSHCAYGLFSFLKERRQDYVTIMSVCVCVCVSNFSFWTNSMTFTKLGMNFIPLEASSKFHTISNNVTANAQAFHLLL